MVGRFTKGSLTVSMIVGTLLVPISALAAIWLTGPSDADEASAATTTTVVPVATVVSTPETTTAGVTRADLQTACGPEGKQLIALEEQGTISDVQQAALDALRDLCDQQGFPLPAKPAPEPIVQTVVVPAAPTATTVTPTTATTNGGDHYEDDDRYEDDDHDEYEDEDDHYEDDDHHEDDEHDEEDD